jgi:hypothetical protein
MPEEESRLRQTLQQQRPRQQQQQHRVSFVNRPSFCKLLVAVRSIASWEPGDSVPISRPNCFSKWRRR